MVASVAARAAQTTAGFFAVLVFGVFCANYPKRPNQLISPGDNKVLGKLTMLVMSPLLLSVTLAEGFEHELAVDMAVMLGWAALSVALCITVGYVAATVVAVPKSFRDEFMVGSAFNNAFAAPVIMMQTLCQQDPLDTATFGADGDISCEDRALTWITVYTTGWIVLFFGVAYPWLMPSVATGAGDELGCKATANAVMAKMLNPNLVASLLGVGAGAIGPLQTALFEGELVWLSSAVKTLGQPCVGLSALIVGTTLGQTCNRLWARRPAGCCGMEAPRALAPAARPTKAFGFAVQTNAGATGPGELEEPADEALPSTKVLAAFVATRMVLCPAAGIALVYFLADTLITSASDEDARLIKLVLVLEAVVPSADFVILTCTVAGRTSAAQALALAYLFQYLVGVLTWTAATGFALDWIYGSVDGSGDAAAQGLNASCCVCNASS